MQSLLRTLVLGLVGAVLVPIAIVIAQSGRAQTPKILQGEIGTWKLNLAKSKYDPANLAPKVATMSTREMTAQGVKVTTKGVDAQGKPIDTLAMLTYDGKDYAVKGNPNWDTASAKIVDPLTAEITRKRNGKVAQ